MKVKRSQLKNYLRKSLLKEFVPGPVEKSPSVSAKMKELERVSKKPGEGGNESGGFYFRFDDNSSIGKETVTVPFKESKTTKDSLFDTALKFARNWTPTEWLRSFYTSDYDSIFLPGAYDAGDKGGDILESKVNLWAPGYFLYNKNANDRKIAADPGFDGNITILGTYVPNYQTENGRVLIETQDASHIVIRAQDVEKLANQVRWLLSEPCLPEDIANVDRIMGFLSGDSNAFQDVFGTGTSIDKKAEQYVKQTANKIFGTKFDESKFSRNYGNRVVCAENDSDKSPLFDAVEYFNEHFNTDVESNKFRYPSCKYVERYPAFSTTGRKPGDDRVGYNEVSVSYNSNDIKNISEERSKAIQNQIDGIKAVRDVIDDVPINPDINKKASDFLISLGALTSLLNKIKNRYDKTLTVNSDASGFNNVDAAPAFENVRRSVQTSNESFVNRRGKNLLTESLDANAINDIINNWFNEIGVQQVYPGLENNPAAMNNGTVTAQFFTSDNPEAPDYSEDIVAGDTPTEAGWVAEQFIAGLREADVFKVEEITLDPSGRPPNPNAAVGKTLVIKNATDIAYFIKLPNDNYLSPFEISNFKSEMESQLREYLGKFEVDQFQIGEREMAVQGTENDGAEEEPEQEEATEETTRTPIGCPNYNQSTKDLVIELEGIVNAYNKSINASETMTVDGKWRSIEDTAWGAMVAHALGANGKSPAKEMLGASLNPTLVNLLKTNWKEGSKKLVANGMKGYTGNAAGALAFVYDAYSNGENTNCLGWKRPITRRRSSGGSAPSTPEQPKSTTKSAAGTIKVEFAGNLANNRKAEEWKEAIKAQMKYHVPENVDKEIKLPIKVGIGGKPTIASYKSTYSRLRDPETLLRFIKRDVIKGAVRTVGTINISISPGSYTINESPVKELVALIKELVKKQ